jgi:hypothetical protein
MTDLRKLYFTSRMHGLAMACIVAGALSLCSAASGQEVAPGELVRATIQNEMKDSNSAHSHLFTWKERKYRAHIPQIAQVVDTPSGAVSRLLLIDGKPLSPAQRSEEEQRNRKMLDPAQMRHRQKEQQEDDQRTRKMLATIPDAFDFKYLGSSPSPNGHKLTRIEFIARPGFDPPNRESMVFTGMKGEMLIDETAGRLAKIDGTLFKEVNFGWGILGKLYTGGRFFVEQSEVVPSHWDTSKMILHFDGKALFLKPIHIDDNETSWDYQTVPPMSVEQAVDFLRRSEQQPAQNARLDH